MRRVVVTGGAGFIGSHLSEELAKRGYHVVILDDLSTGKMANIEPLLNQKAVEFVAGSIMALPLLQELFQATEYVFHLAAIPSVPRSIENPMVSHQTNLTGTLNVLLAARDNKVKKLVYSSSSSVYGDTPTLPKREDMLPNPQSPYAVAKLGGEYYCQVFYQVYRLPTISLRYFNVYGPGQDPDSPYAAVIPRFIRTISEGNQPVIFGDGEQTRDFTFVQDVVQAIILAAESKTTGVFNVGSSSSITINRLTELIIRLMGSQVKPLHAENRSGDIKHSLADISRSRAFGYQPKFNLEEGVRQTVSSFQTNRFK